MRIELFLTDETFFLLPPFSFFFFFFFFFFSFFSFLFYSFGHAGMNPYYEAGWVVRGLDNCI